MTIYSLTYSFSYLEPVCCSMSSSNYCFLTCIQVSQEAGQVVWYSRLFQNFPQFILIHTVKGFGIVNKAEIDVFLKLSCFFPLLCVKDTILSPSVYFWLLCHKLIDHMYMSLFLRSLTNLCFHISGNSEQVSRILNTVNVLETWPFSIIPKSVSILFVCWVVLAGN